VGGAAEFGQVLPQAPALEGVVFEDELAQGGECGGAFGGWKGGEALEGRGQVPGKLLALGGAGQLRQAEGVRAGGLKLGGGG
jgi:hypothetical protein